MGFDQVFRSRAGVEAVFASRKQDVHGNSNLIDGRLDNVSEWRQSLPHVAGTAPLYRSVSISAGDLGSSVAARLAR